MLVQKRRWKRIGQYVNPVFSFSRCYQADIFRIASSKMPTIRVTASCSANFSGTGSSHINSWLIVQIHQDCLIGPFMAMGCKVGRSVKTPRFFPTKPIAQCHVKQIPYLVR